MEIWKDIKGFEGIYQVSNMGRVKSLSRAIPSKNGSLRVTKEKYKALGNNGTGYYHVTLSDSRVNKIMYVHRLVASAFLSRIPEHDEVNHLNGEKDDNRAENLEWVTRSANRLHAYEIGLQQGKRGSASHLSKLTHDEALEIFNSPLPTKEIAKKYNISNSSVRFIKTKKRWAWLH